MRPLLLSRGVNGRGAQTGVGEGRETATGTDEPARTAMEFGEPGRGLRTPAAKLIFRELYQIRG